MTNFARLFVTVSFAVISHAACAWTSIVSGPWVAPDPRPYINNSAAVDTHYFYVSGVWPGKYQAQGQAIHNCYQNNTTEFNGQCKVIADFDGPAVIALVTAQNHYWAASADRDTNVAVKKALSLCHHDKAEECVLTDVYWDFGHNLMDAPESFKQLYMKLHDGNYWQPLSGYWFR